MATKANAYFIDSGLTYSGASATTITGLGHLEGETVAVLGDGAYLGTYTVLSGSITLTSAVTKAHIGLAYTSTVKPTKLDIEGMGLAIKKRIVKAIVSFYNTLGGLIGDNTASMTTITFRTTGDETNASPDLFTGTKEISFSGDYERDADIIIQQTQPLPMTIRGIILKCDAVDD